MPERQVAYAAVRYTDASGHVLVAHRGDVIDFPDAEIKRLQGLGALVAVDAELTMPGVLLPLTEEAPDEKIRNYLVSGNGTEIITQAGEYPTGLVEKLLLAEKSGLARDTVIDGLNRLLAVRVVVAGSTPSEIIPDPAAQVLDPPENPSTPDLEDFVSESNMPTVLERVGDDKDLAQQILTIEQANSTPRKGLIEALQKVIDGEQQVTPVEGKTLEELVQTQSVSDVLAIVGDDKQRAQEALDLETPGKNRKTLVDGLKAVIAA